MEEIHRRPERLDRLAVSGRSGRLTVIRPCPRGRAAARRPAVPCPSDRPPDPPPGADRQYIGFVIV